MTKDEFIKNVSIVDKDAGDKLDDIINMSLAVQKYADLIEFGDAYARTDSTSAALIRTFIWRKTLEGHTYWKDIYEKIMKKEGFLERVSKVDPEAAKKLKEMYKRAALNLQYAEKINFTPIEDAASAATIVYKLFLWEETEEGVDYWINLKNKLLKANL